MTFIATFLSAFFGLGLIIGIHEFGHAFAMKKLGVGIKRITIGIPIPFCQKLKLEWRWSAFPESPITVFPIPIFGYVQKADEECFNNFSYRDLVSISAAGGYVNLLFGFFLAILSYVANGQIRETIPLVVVLLVLVILRKGFAVWIMPALGALLLFLMVWLILHRPLNEISGGPITVFSEMAAKGYTPLEMIHFIGLISVGIGLLNLIPIPPLDGGVAIFWVLRRRNENIASVFLGVGVVIVLALLSVSIWTDAKLLLNGVRHLLFD